MIRPHLSAEDFQYTVDSSRYVPERRLLIAVLERAVLDLKPYAPKEDRRQAIAWFEAKACAPTDYAPIFTFKQISEAFGLSKQAHSIIQTLVTNAKAYGKRPTS